MTEYDYSPDAIERHLAKLDGITKWVDKTRQHEPVNPFAPLPGEHVDPSDSYPPSPPRSPPQIQQQPYGYPYSYQYQYPYQTAPHYPQQQLYYPTQPQHAFYATPQGIISPTYSSMHTSSSSRHHRSHHSSSRHSSGSRSHLPSPTRTFLPMALGPRSYSTPPLQTSPYGSSYQLVQVAQLMYPLPAGYTTMPASGSTPAGSPYSAYSVPQVAMAPVSRGRSKSRSRSDSYSASRSSSHYSGRSKSKSRSRSYSVSYPAQSQPQVQTSQNVYGVTMGAYGSQSTTYLQPTPDQPVIVPINGGVGGYVVVPAKGQGVTVLPQQQQQYYDPRHHSRSYGSDSGSERGSFFGSLGLRRKDKKSRRHKRTGSY